MKLCWQEVLAVQYGLGQDQIMRFEKLLDRIQHRADRGLTAVTRPESIIRVHFLDSLWLLRLPEISNVARIMDIGSGAGFPGLPLAIAMPGTFFAMIEANNKKAAFIAGMIEELGLNNAQVFALRAEDAGKSAIRESFDVALARAVGSLPEVLEYTLPLVRKGGHALLQRGAREPGDNVTAAGAAVLLGGALVRIVPANPYPEAKNLNLWVWEKRQTTPDKYPRRAGMPRKRPLGG